MPDQRQRAEHQDRGNARPHCRFGERDVDGVQSGEETGGKKAVDPSQHGYGKKIPKLQQRQRRNRKHGEEEEIDQILYESPPSTSPRIGSTFPWSAARANA